jgi:hypothetical protein
MRQSIIGSQIAHFLFEQLQFRLPLQIILIGVFYAVPLSYLMTEMALAESVWGMVKKNYV